MKRLLTTLAATTAFAVAPAMADHHMDDGDKTSGEKYEEKSEMDEASLEDTDTDETGVEVSKAVQAFLAIDEENDGVLTKEEWTAWQNNNDMTDELFEDYDADGDGDIELSEYMETYDS